MTYRKIDGKFWGDAKVRSLSHLSILVCLFVMTHPGLTMLGAMRATVPGLAAELGMELEAFRKAFREVLSIGIAKHDEAATFLWLPNFMKHNKPQSPNVVKAWPKAFDELPECDLKCELFESLKAFTEGMTEEFVKAFAEGFSMTSLNQQQQQQQEEKENRPSLKRPSADYDNFIETWNRSCGPLAKVTKLTAGRRDKLRIRMAEGLTSDLFLGVVKTCATTPFLRGENDRKWRANFDWVIENDHNLVAVCEGKYGPPQPSGSSTVGYLVGDAYSSPEYELDAQGGVQ